MYAIGVHPSQFNSVYSSFVIPSYSLKITTVTALSMLEPSTNSGMVPDLYFETARALVDFTLSGMLTNFH